MKINRRIDTRFLLIATLTIAAASSVACAPQPVPEEKGVSKAKLLAPRPMMKASASPASRDGFGVFEWRLYRGRNDVVLTGYDDDGKPVKGVSVGFHASDASEATLRTRVLDGSMFAARHEYARSRTVESGRMPEATASFLRQALSDIAVLRQSVARSTQSGATAGRTFGTSPQCGADMMAIISSALSCIQSGGGAANPSVVQQCIAAAQTASNAGSACQVTGTTPFDPTQVSDPWGAGGWGDPMGACGQAADPWGQGGGAGLPCGGQDPYGQGGVGADPWGGGAQDPYGQGGNPYDQGGWGGGTPTGDWCSDPFGDGACPSCGGANGMGDMGGMGGMDDWGNNGNNGGMGGGMGDIYANPMNGDVGYEGDFGGDTNGGWNEGF